MDNVVYWLKGEDRQNFGDYLTEYFMKHLFLETSRHRADIKILRHFSLTILFPTISKPRSRLTFLNGRDGKP